MLGLLEGVRLGYAAQDINVHLLTGDTFAAAHWGAIGKAGNQNPWRGPDVAPGTPLRKITPEQWQALTPYDTAALERPALAVDMIAAALPDWKFTPCFEVKPGEGTQAVRPYALLKAAAVVHQVPIIVMTIQSYGSTVVAKAAWETSAKARLKAAKAAGLPTMLLWRHHIPLDSDWWPLLDAVKGAPASQVLPPGVVHVPQTATTAHARTVLGMVTAKIDWTPEELPVVAPLRIDGADLSHHQSGKLDFGAFAKAGGRFVYHKATEGDTFTDDKYVQRMGEVRAAGLTFGAYHYAHPDSSSGVDQARRFLSVARPMPGDMLPALDLETTGGLNQVELTKWTGAFVGEVKRQFGVLPVIYTNQNLTSDFGCPLWVARYSNSNAAPVMPTPFTRISIRQFSNGVYGVPKRAAGLGAVDLNHLPDGVKLADLRIPTAPPPEVAVTDDRYDRVTFRDGKTVNKWTRQALLAVEADLGYTLTLVQGSYHKGVGASAGTHDGGGAVDLAPYRAADKVLALRRHGFAAWHRLPIPGVWGEHVHAVLIGDTDAAPLARTQVAAYRNGYDGLGHLGQGGRDNGPRVPIREFRYDPRRFDDVDEKTLRKIIAEETDKAVAKYVGDVVEYPTEANPANKVWISTALSRLLKKTGA